MNLSLNANEGRVCRRRGGSLRLGGQGRPLSGSDNLTKS